MRLSPRSAVALLLLAACARAEPDENAGDSAAARSASTPAPCAAGSDTTLRLPTGFCATIFADTSGGPRHVAVAANGDVFAALISLKKGVEAGSGAGGIVAFRDTDRDGRADTSASFGKVGGTGIALFDGHVYADEVTRIVRYPLPAGALAPSGPAEVIVSGIPDEGHEARNFAIGSDGALYVNVGSETNSCQLKDRGTESRGHDPCTELETRAGIWKFDARTPNQRFSAQARFSTGNRNAMGLAFGPDGRLWATQHGRDQLFQNWGKLFDAKYSAENPGEELMQVNQGDDFGWPYCYWSNALKKRVTAPEYGGDGTKDDRCGAFKAPVATFGGHWAPMSLLFYRGSQFPARYRDGAFIAFHGSWNRAPESQEGYRVVFQPLSGGASSGAFETFADGFAGATVSPQGAVHRPIGLAEAPDGALFITDDKGGRIWRVTYGGGR